MYYLPALLHRGKLIRPDVCLTTHHGYPLTLCFPLLLHKTNLQSAFCLVCVFSKGLRKAFFFVGRGTSQTKNVVFVSMRTPSRLAHKIPYTKPFSSLWLVLPFHTRVVLVSSLTAVSYFTTRPTHYSKYFHLFWCIESQSNPLLRLFRPWMAVFAPVFSPSGFFFRSPILELGRQLKIFLAPAIPRTVAGYCCYTQPTYILLSES